MGVLLFSRVWWEADLLGGRTGHTGCTYLVDMYLVGLCLVGLVGLVYVDLAGSLPILGVNPFLVEFLMRSGRPGWPLWDVDLVQVLDLCQIIFFYSQFRRMMLNG